MITQQQAEQIVDNYILNGEIVKEHLAKVMEFEGIDQLVYRVYTPSFNDGDPCEFTVSFFGKPFSLLEDHYVILNGEEIETTDYYECENLDEELSKLVPPEHAAVFSMPYGKYGSEEHKAKMAALEKLEPSYKLENFEKMLHTIAPIILQTNTEGVISLAVGTVNISANEYDPGY